MPPVTTHSVAKQLLYLTPDEANTAFAISQLARELAKRGSNGVPTRKARPVGRPRKKRKYTRRKPAAEASAE